MPSISGEYEQHSEPLIAPLPVPTMVLSRQPLLAHPAISKNKAKSKHGAQRQESQHLYSKSPKEKETEGKGENIWRNQSMRIL